MGFGVALAGMEDRSKTSRNRIFSIGLCNLVVRSGGSRPAYVLRHAVLPELCEQCLSVGPDRRAVPPAQTRTNASAHPHSQTPARSASLAARADWKIDGICGRVVAYEDWWLEIRKSGPQCRIPGL